MPNIQQLVVTDLADASLTVNRFQVACKVTADNNDLVVVADFTGANALTFPGTLATLTAQQRRTLLRSLVHRMILMKAGIDPGDP